MKRKHKTYSKPKRPFDKARIDEEAIVKKEFGLKNKKEIWKAEAKIKTIRERAKKLITADANEQQTFFDKLKKIGLEVNSIAEVLSLDKKDYLNRRLQTVVLKKGLVTTSKTARQMITHKKVLVGGNIVNVPSYIVPVELENKITLKMPKAKPKKVEKKEEKVKKAAEVKEDVKEKVKEEKKDE